MLLTDEQVAALLDELATYTARDLAAVPLTREPDPPPEEGEDDAD